MLLLTGLTLLALLLRLPLLGWPIWFDEACASDQRLGSFAQLLAVLYVDSNPPLFATFMHLWNGVFGDGELALRAPALLTGVACVPLTFWAGSRLVGADAAMWAAALLALSPAHAWYSAEAQPYTPMVASTLFAFGSFDRLLDPTSPTIRRWLWPAHLVNVVVMLGLHYYLAAPVVILALLAPVVARGFTGAARAIVQWHGVGVLLLALYVFLDTRIGAPEAAPHYVRPLTAGGLFDFVFGWCWTGNTVQATHTALADGAATVLEVLGVAAVAAGLLTLWRRRHAHPRGWLVVIGVLHLPALVLLGQATGHGDTFVECAMTPTLPFVLLLAGAGVTAAGRAQPVAGGAAVAAATTALLALFANGEDHWTVYRPKSDWRSAAAWLGAEVDAGGAGRSVFTPTPNPRALSYYDPRIQDQKNLRAPTTPEELGRKVSARLGAWLGGVAERTFADLLEQHEQLLRDARLLVRRSHPTPQALELPADRPDDICYLVRDRWHPPLTADRSVEALLSDPHVEVLETRRFTGIDVHKVRIRP
ncbi:MAG: glycosyltransferase family 39 protein [Planctomycetes bacterium]|nr:glycosyltransferase family 39 protein [Planctomycetota bacterium]